jgi:hypothetical protein
MAINESEQLLLGFIGSGEAVQHGCGRAIDARRAGEPRIPRFATAVGASTRNAWVLLSFAGATG